MLNVSSRRKPGQANLPQLLTSIFVAALTIVSSFPARANLSELEHELYREMHRGPQVPLPPPPELSAETLACYERLSKVAHFVPFPMQSEPAQCAVPDLVRLDRVTMTDQTQTTINPPAIVRCVMAEAWSQWIRVDVGPATVELGAPLAAVTGVGSYECRGRNRIPGAKLSEHGRGNAIDFTAIKLRNGALFNLTDRLASKPFRELVRSLTCARFMTVLGPGSDGYHNEHIHLDLAERSNAYRMCQWNVLDAEAVTAEIPLPPSRPAVFDISERVEVSPRPRPLD